MNDCLFCKIINREMSSQKIYEDENTFAFLDTNPVNKGHTLVIPKKHYKNIYDIPENLFCDVIKTIKKLSSPIKEAMKANGINIMMNNDSPAGQLIFHAHFHIIPRFAEDGFRHWLGKPYASQEEAVKIAEKIKNSF